VSDVNSVANIVYSFLKTKLITIGIPSEKCFLYVLDDTPTKFYDIPAAMIYFDIANDENIFTKQYSQRNISNTENYIYNKVVSQTLNCIVNIFDSREKIFLHKDRFYTVFNTDVIPYEENDITNNIKLNFKRNQIASLESKKPGVCVAQIFMEFMYSLFFIQEGGYKITDIDTSNVRYREEIQ
jgi:hypothetical protein